MNHCNDIVAIPVHNEENTVRNVVDCVRKNYKCDILAINDGSTDNSGKILDSIANIKVIHHTPNRGYGQTLIDAFEYAIANGYGRLVTIDCDEQHEPQLIPVFFREIGDADILSGTRYLKNLPGDTSAPPDREKINRIMTKIVNDYTAWNLTDTFCGFKCYKVDALKKLNLTETGYGIPMQFWPQAFKAGLVIHEYPITRIYKNFERSFGASLDNPLARAEYYLKTFIAETEHEYSSLANRYFPEEFLRRMPK